MKSASTLQWMCQLAVALSSSPAALAADWPQWRGPERDGISTETGLLAEWPKDGPKLVWQQKDLGTGYSTPAVVGERLYLLGNNGLDNEFVQALNAADGKPAWSTTIGKVGSLDQKPPYPGARSTPTVDGDSIYALGSDGDLVCLETETGKPRWQKNVRAEFKGKPGEWAYSESPLVDGDVLVCTPGGSEATLVALNKADGEVIWKAPIAEEEAAYSSVIACEIAGIKQYVQFLQKGVVGVDAATGELLWRYDGTAKGSPANIPTPLVHNDHVYTSSGLGAGGLVKLSRAEGRLVVEEKYLDGNLPKGIGGVVLVGDHFYGANKTLMCVEYLTGNVKWQDRSIGASSALYADGLLFLHGENGEVALAEATPEGYREKGRFTPPEQPDRGQSKAWAYPVVANGRLYIFDWGTLWCFDVAGADGERSAAVRSGNATELSQIGR